MHPLAPWTALALALAALAPPAAGDDIDRLQRTAECRAAALDDVTILIGYSRAWPGAIVSADAFQLDQRAVGVDPCVASGGSVTFAVIDPVAHYPVSDERLAGVYNHCIDAVRDTGSWLTLGETYRLTFTYDAATRTVLVDPDGDGPVRPCGAGVAEATDDYAAVPFHCYLHASEPGVLLVQAAPAASR